VKSLNLLPSLETPGGLVVHKYRRNWSVVDLDHRFEHLRFINIIEKAQR